MKVRAVQKVSRRIEKQDPRGAVVKRLLSMAELFRTQAKITEEAEEALRWEKDLRKRQDEIEALAS